MSGLRLQDGLLRLVTARAARIDLWVDALLDRHTRAFTSPEFLKAIRALSARYVEHRTTLPSRSPIDSAGKRAAFAAFYAPLHFFTARAVVDALGLAATGVRSILDLGCGTAPVSSAWAIGCDRQPSVVAVDRDAWSLTEASWNWRALGLDGRTRRLDMVRALDETAGDLRRLHTQRLGVTLGWSVNELPRGARDDALAALLAAHRRGASILVLEPLARTAAPWWDSWQEPVVAAGGRADVWKFDIELPARLASLDEAAGFRREGLGVRTLWLAADD